MNREDGETEDTFRRRVYAMRLANKPLVQMSDADLEQVLAAADERLAKELVDTGTISDASLERVVSTGSN